MADLPEPFAAVGDPISPLPEFPRGRSGVGQSLQRRVELRAAPKTIEVPEIQGNGAIRRCVIVLDPKVADVDEATSAALIQHEIGHCLGFLGHVGSGLMAPSVELGNPSFTIVPEVTNMMRTLYRLPPGTHVTR